MWHTNRRLTALLIWAACALCATLMSCGPRDGAATRNVQPQGGGEQTVSITVADGDKPAAEKYYAETFAALGLTAAHDLARGEPRMSVMLAYLGHPDLKPSDLEDVPSADLMKRVGGDLLASAFFAPKITDVSGKGPDDINVGWRKVIRLRARADSDAARHGIAAGFLLFNKFQGRDHALDPFKPREDRSNESKTTQLILVRAAKGSGADPAQRPLHFFVFGPVSDGAQLKLALQASFDAASPEVEAELAKKNPIKDYFVPVACGQCHGGIRLNPDTGDEEVLFDRQKLNFLDTDHWFDRVQDGDDFAFIRTDRKFGVIFDGGADESSAQFTAAFDVLRALNGEIKAQNDAVEPNPAKPSFQLRAAGRWLELHPAGDIGHKDLFARALPPLPGAAGVWNAASDTDRALLPLMNRFCYRCHSSIAYSLFDRNEVACRRDKIKTRVNLPPGSAGSMPQDRALDPAAKAALLELVGKLPDAQCVK